MNDIRCVWVMVAAALLSGCESPTDPHTILFDSNPIESARYKTLIAKYADLEKVVTEFEQADPEPSPAESREFRNNLVRDLLWLVDSHYYSCKKKLYYGRAGTSFVADAITLGLNAAGAVTGGASLKAVLAATSAGVVGLEASANSNFFRDKTTEVLVLKMDELRDRQRTVILARMVRSVSQYSVRDALSDVHAYLDQGHIVTAVVEISKDIAPKADGAASAVKQAERYVASTSLTVDATAVERFSPLVEQFLELLADPVGNADRIRAFHTAARSKGYVDFNDAAKQSSATMTPAQAQELADAVKAELAKIQQR